MVERKVPVTEPKKTLHVAVSADHRGVELKKKLVDFLARGGIKVADLGVSSEEPADYPDVAFPLAERVAAKEFDYGILVCMSGTGMAICANKVRGVRAAICDNLEQAKLSREHNDANVLILGAKFVAPELACQMAKEWLATPFEGGRHEQRVRKIMDFESKHP